MILDRPVHFGQYNGQGWTWRDVIDFDPEYVLWLLENAPHRFSDEDREVLKKETFDPDPWPDFELWDYGHWE